MNRFSGHALPTNNDALPAVFFPYSYSYMELYGVFFFFLHHRLLHVNQTAATSPILLFLHS